LQLGTCQAPSLVKLSSQDNTKNIGTITSSKDGHTFVSKQAIGAHLTMLWDGQKNVVQRFNKQNLRNRMIISNRDFTIPKYLSFAIVTKRDCVTWAIILFKGCEHFFLPSHMIGASTI
jgi:hypothetical protein